MVKVRNQPWKVLAALDSMDFPSDNPDRKMPSSFANTKYFMCN